MYYQYAVSAYPHPIPAVVILPESNAMRTPGRVTFCKSSLSTRRNPHPSQSNFATCASSHGTFRTRAHCRPSTSTSSPNHTSSGWRRSPFLLFYKNYSTTNTKTGNCTQHPRAPPPLQNELRIHFPPTRRRLATVPAPAIICQRPRRIFWRRPPMRGEGGNDRLHRVRRGRWSGVVCMRVRVFWHDGPGRRS